MERNPQQEYLDHVINSLKEKIANMSVDNAVLEARLKIAEADNKELAEKASTIDILNRRIELKEVLVEDKEKQIKLLNETIEQIRNQSCSCDSCTCNE